MKGIQVTIIGLLLSFGLSVSAHAGDYKLDESHTRLGFSVRHLGFSKVRGQFNKFEGKGTFDERTNHIGKLNVEIDVSSVDTNEPDRDKHLRTADFFSVKKYPKIKFESTKVTYLGKKPKEIHGKITMRGVTKPIVLKITEWGGTAEDAWGNKRVAFEASTVIDRRDFGLTWNKTLKTAGGLTVGNDVTFELEIQGIKMD